MQTTHQIDTPTLGDTSVGTASRKFRLPEQPRAPEPLCKRVGSVAELREFVAEHADEIQSKARVLCYGSRDAALEVLQELYPRLLSMLRRNPQGLDNVWAVSHSVMARLAIDGYRKHRRALRTKQLADPSELSDSGTPPPPERGDRHALHAAVESLPDRLRVIVCGIFIEGCKAKDVAKKVGLSESRVAELKTEALTLLRKRLGE